MDGVRKERKALKVSLSFENMKREEERKGKARVNCGKVMEAVEEQEAREKGKEKPALALLSSLVTGSNSWGWSGWDWASLFSSSRSNATGFLQQAHQIRFSQQLWK